MSVMATPSWEPLLDHAGVEAARLVHLARRRLVTAEPSVTYALLARARDQQEATVRQWVRRLRQAEKLVTVDHDGATLIPAFQFDEAYDPRPEVTAVVQVLSGAGLDAWAIWHWFTTQNGWLDERPVDGLAEQRHVRVAQAARRLADVAGVA